PRACGAVRSVWGSHPPPAPPRPRGVCPVVKNTPPTRRCNRLSPNPPAAACAPSILYPDPVFRVEHRFVRVLPQRPAARPGVPAEQGAVARRAQAAPRHVLLAKHELDLNIDLRPDVEPDQVGHQNDPFALGPGA